MARGQRIDIGDLVYHVINRANGRFTIFESDTHYRDFEDLLRDGSIKYNMRILAYVVMPNHWHLLLYPRQDGDLSQFMKWLGNAHTRHYHAQTRTIGAGHLYQGRYKSFLVDNDIHLLTVLKYIERNPVRANLCEHPDEWRWGSAYYRVRGTAKEKALLTESPTPLPGDYIWWINEPEPSDELTRIRKSNTKGLPYGKESWVESMVDQYKLIQTTRTSGRPRKNGD